MTINTSTFDHNNALGVSDVPGGGGWGGGVANDGVLTLSQSTFVGNTAKGNGAGLYNTGTLTVSNSTFNNNGSINGSVSFGFGGGLYNSGSATLSSTTMFGNLASNSGGGIKGDVTLANTLVAGNSSVNTGSDDISGAVTSQGYNLVGNSTGATGLGATDLKDAAAIPLTLGPLANNGGPTQTIALITGSTAINGGDPAYGGLPAYDQRGVGFPRVRGGRIDIGAYEAPLGNTLDIQLTLQGRPAAPNDAYVVTVHVTLSPAAGGSPVVSGDYASDTSGHVVIADVPTGDFSLTVKGTRTLATTQSVTLVTGSNSVVTPALKEGDADGSNGVTIADFSILAESFGLSDGQIGFDARADFNGDEQVTIADFSLLATSFGQQGAP
ncbi:MAG: hypothetical protein IPK19_39665 [Chloroflexi bacterium]|nr:hypothetical protein [Chloroflexota bacterium]